MFAMSRVPVCRRMHTHIYYVAVHSTMTTFGSRTKAYLSTVAFIAILLLLYLHLDTERREDVVLQTDEEPGCSGDIEEASDAHTAA